MRRPIPSVRRWIVAIVSAATLSCACDPRSTYSVSGGTGYPDDRPHHDAGPAVHDAAVRDAASPMSPSEAGVDAASPPGDAAPFRDAAPDGPSGTHAADGGLPALLRIPLSVHTRDSLFTDDQIIERLGEVQTIWAQARICFEMLLDDEGPADAGPPSRDGGTFETLELWMVQVVPRFPLANGLYDGFLGAYVRDEPVLAPAPHPVTFPFARTAAHEMGHLFGLRHYADEPDAADSLMSSRNSGFLLHDFEIAEARRVAAALSLDDTTLASCAPPRRGSESRVARPLPDWFPVVDADAAVIGSPQ